MTPSHRCRSNRDCLRLLAAVLALVCGVPETAISVPFTHSTPTGTSSGSPTNDLRTTLSFEPLQHYGYQPVTLSIQAVKPVARDRQITVRVYADRRFNGATTRYDQAVEQDAELPAGAASLKVQMLIPKLHDWGIVHWEVWVDGRLDTELSGWAPQQNAGVQGPIDILKPVDSQQPDLLGLARMLSTPWSRGQPNGFIEASATPLPHDWRALEGYHAVVLPFAELRAQAATNPAGMKALRKWVALGGRLLVEDVGQEFQRLADLDSFLGQHSYPFDRELARDQQPDKPPKAGEEEEQVDVVVKPPPFPATPSWKWAQLMLPRPRDLDEAEESDNSEGRRARESVDGWFLEAPLGFGAVAAFPESLQDVPDFRSEGELAERFSSYETRWLQRAVVGYLARWDWSERHGLTPDRGNEEFSNWLVPGVGAAPVDAFRLLITLFVLLVGPASFFVLRAYHRTQLMALTAPLAAAAFTLCLFAYATFSDGVGLRVRARSLTLLNQDTGEAVSWSRQSYYAGLAPAEGLTFPVGSAVYPIKAAWEVTDVNDSKHYMRELMIEAEAERYSQGWLASRQTSQMLVLDSEETSAQLEFGGPAEQPRVTNKLGADINHLFVLDHQANWWSASGVGQGETQPLDSQNRASIVAATRTAFLEAAPTYPPGIDGATPRGSINPFDLRRSRDRFGRLSGASLVDGQLERLLSQIEGRGDGLTTPLRPGAYVAITSRSVCAPLGHADARELGSFHVTLGVWEAAAL